jgi:hypothetical protein
LIQPRVIGTLGNFATKLLTRNPTGITRVRGTAQEHAIGGRTVYVLPLFHPAAGLRTPAVADTLRQDFASLPELLERPLPDGPRPLDMRGGSADARGLREEPPVSRGEEPPVSGQELEPDQLGLFG